MTDKVYPSQDASGKARYVAGAIQFAGGSDEGWIIPSGDDPNNLAAGDSDITEGNLDAFSESHSSSTFDVTINAGAAFLGGAWLARDTSTTVTLDASTNDQSVYVAWDTESNHTVVIKKGNSNIASRNPRAKIWTFDTDSNGVTSTTDERNLDDYRIRDADLSDSVVTTDRLSHESGTFSDGSMSSASTQSISFNNTYVAGGAQLSIEQDLDSGATLLKATWDGWQTDADGNYTGADISYQITDSTGTINWTVQGVKTP